MTIDEIRSNVSDRLTEAKDLVYELELLLEEIDKWDITKEPEYPEAE